MSLSFEQNVEYALNDAIIFREYVEKTLGVKKENITLLENANAITMSREIKRVTGMVKALGEKAELIVYYAGHGIATTESDNIPYLIPVDVPGDDLFGAIKLDKFFQDLSATGASKITIFLDACFTGGGRDLGLIASRGISVTPKQGSLSGNLLVFSASSGTQSSLPYKKEEHGMFTYYLLKYCFRLRNRSFYMSFNGFSGQDFLRIDSHHIHCLFTHNLFCNF